MQANIWWKGKSCLHAPKAENVKGQGKIPQLKTETALNRESASCDPPAPLCVKSCPKSALGVPEALCAQPVLCCAHSLACTASPVTEPQNYGILRGWNGPQSSFCCIPLPWARTPSAGSHPAWPWTPAGMEQPQPVQCLSTAELPERKLFRSSQSKRQKNVCDYLQQSP